MKALGIQPALRGSAESSQADAGLLLLPAPCHSLPFDLLWLFSQVLVINISCGYICDI
jgi:hypothetical protein